MLYNNNYYTDLDVSKLLKEAGFNEWCDVAWTTGAIVRDEIIEKYPGLSDDGYYELTEICGGELKWEEVYSNDFHLDNLNNRNSDINDDYGIDFGYSAPLIQQALDFIRKVFSCEIEFRYDADGYWIHPISTITLEYLTESDPPLPYISWEEAMNAGIKAVLKYHIND